MFKSEIAAEYIKKYIELSKQNGYPYSKRYIATQLFNEHPEFGSVELARSIIRTITNCHGTQNRRINNKYGVADQFRMLEGQFNELVVEPFIMPEKYKNTLVIADLHSRFCNMDVLKMTIEYAIKRKCDSVIIDGDFMDFYSFSRFDKNPLVMEQFMSEKEWGIGVLELLQDIFKYVVLKKGNHDKRREEYVLRANKDIPEGIEASKYENYLSFEGSKVVFVEDYNRIICGKANIIHGHEFQSGAGIHIAYTRLNKAMDNVISAHSHKSQTFIRKDINGSVFGSYAIGCMCDLHPRYNPMNDWTNGFGIITQENDGLFEFENKIIHGKNIFNV
jgi:metallophosphoesterase superfamily enzyme